MLSLAVPCFIVHLTMEQGLGLLWKGVVLFSLLNKHNILNCRNIIMQLELSVTPKESGKQHSIPYTRVQHICTP